MNDQLCNAACYALSHACIAAGCLDDRITRLQPPVLLSLATPGNASICSLHLPCLLNDPHRKPVLVAIRNSFLGTGSTAWALGQGGCESSHRGF